MDERRYRIAEDALWARYGAAPTERWIDIDSPRARVRVRELGAGAPVVFLHGAPNAGAVWAPLAARLDAVRRIVVDRPGCGLSPGLDPVLWDRPRDTVLAVMDGLLDGLSLSRVTLVGSSLGGAWTLWYALNRPERVRAVVLEGCPALVPGMRVTAPMRLLAATGLYRLMRFAPVTPRMSRLLAWRIGHGQGERSGRIPDEYFRWNAALFTHTDTARHDFRMMAEAVGARGIRPELRLEPDRLRTLQPPALLLWGEKDNFGDADVGRRLARTLPRAELVVFEGTGHLPWLDTAGEQSSRIRSFLERA